MFSAKKTATSLHKWWSHSIKEFIKNLKVINKQIHKDLEIITIEAGELTISSVYKPPAILNGLPSLPTTAHPCVLGDDFNSHHFNWRNRNNDENGENLRNG